MDKYVSLLKTWSGESEDLCFLFYRMLKEEAEAAQLEIFQMLCESTKHIDSDESHKIEAYFEDGEIARLKKLYGQYIDSMIDSVRKKAAVDKLGSSQFYSLLWNIVMDSLILTSDKERALGLLMILADTGIPFYELDESLSMANDEYKRIVQANIQLIEKIKYILSIPFEQKTEVASLILKEILACNDFSVQTVLLAQALELYAKKDIRQIERLLSMTDDTRGGD